MSERGAENRFVVCVGNRGYKASLVVRRIYRSIPDSEAEDRGLLRVIDESGEDYLFPSKLFASIKLSAALGRRFAETT